MAETMETRCCIAGGGPAGMMLGFLLARMGVDVWILEKHADFLRDFRGDTIHPSTLELMYELGLLNEFLTRPHDELREVVGKIGQETVTVGDLTHLPTHCKFIALMPQWDFLNFLAEKGREYQGFHLKMEATVTDLIVQQDRVAGIRVQTPSGELEVRAALLIGADGRHSTVRERAGLDAIDLGAPIDVLWMRLSRRPDDPAQTFGYFNSGKILVLINRRTYWQCGFVIPKGAIDAMKQQGIESLRKHLASLAPFLLERVGELQNWDNVSLLSVKVDRLERWCRPGLLCIGDAAHAMSPIGGVGINLAIQDAVATANILGAKLKQGSVSLSDIEAVQKRREFPARAMQRLQVMVQNNVIRRVLSEDRPLRLPVPLKLLRSWPALRRIPARIIGIGFRPEHIHTPEAS
jgi:2-polyprenyl-6-methoxyphenol hydroxylase-like FAD-dependent oxidoreductase